MFECDSLTGQISLLKEISDFSLPPWSWAISNIAISNADASVYVTNFHSEKLFVFHKDAIKNQFFLVETINKSGAAGILLSHDRKHLYVSGSDGVTLYSRNHETGTLSFIEIFPRVSFYLASGYVLSPDDQTLFLPSVYKRDVMTGRLSGWQSIKQNVGGTDHLHSSSSVAVSANGNFLYVGARYEDAGISIFSRDQYQGRITLSQIQAFEQQDVNAMLLSPDGRHLYVAHVEANLLQVFAPDPQTGDLQLIQARQDKLVDFAYPPAPGLMAFSSDGGHLYFNTAQRLLVYARDAASGWLDLVQEIKASDHQLQERRALAISPDSRHVYWTGQSRYLDKYHVALFSRDAASGQLTLSQQQEFQDFLPSSVLKISSDGRHAYAGALEDEYSNAAGVIAVFARDDATGALSVIEAQRYPGWHRCVDLEIAGNGIDVYGLIDDNYGHSGQLAMLERSLETGRLTQRALFRSWEEGVYGLEEPQDLTLSPDGAFVYIADERGVVTFATGRKNSTAVDEDESLATLPATLKLEQNYPNPFSTFQMNSTPDAASTIIHYEISNTAPVELSIHNLQGQRVRTLVQEIKTPGRYAITWDGTDAQGQQVPSGIYFYRLKTGESVATKRLVIVK
jgi:6-phosphogluconolactonase (cycloisomerase 2 family)